MSSIMIDAMMMMPYVIENLMTFNDAFTVVVNDAAPFGYDGRRSCLRNDA